MGQFLEKIRPILGWSFASWSSSKSHISEREVLLDRGDYIVEVTKVPLDLRKIFKMRYNAFFREYAGRVNPFGFDKDIYDKHADHMVVRIKSTGKIVGYYRFVIGKKSHEFYSSTSMGFCLLHV